MVSASPPIRGGRFCRRLCSKKTSAGKMPANRRQGRLRSIMKRLLFIAVGFLIAFPISASAQKPQSPKKYLKQGLERFGRNDIVGAISDYDRAISIDPNYAEAYLNR